MNILGTGLSGLIGSRLTELLSEHTFEDLSLKTGVDITNSKAVVEKISESPSSWIFHFAAVTDVDAAEKERGNKDGIYWKVNVDSTKTICQAAQTYGKKVLYLSTDYVFDGSFPQYSELDQPRPTSWYAETKYQGELEVLHSNSNNIVVRLANPYRSHPVGKMDFVHKIIHRLTENAIVNAPNDQIYVPTLVDDLVRAINLLVSKNECGIFHVVGSQALTPFEASQEIAKTWNKRMDLIVPTTFEKFFQGRAPRPFHAVLKHDKITALGMQMSSFVDGIHLVQKQEEQTLA